MATEQAKSGIAGTGGEEGQSVLEFLLMLPMMIGLVMILVRVNTAIQISINDQQYARAHTLNLNFNSPVYPFIDLRERELVPFKYNHMLLGVANEEVKEDPHPKATTHYVARRKGVPDRDDKTPNERALVRVRDTVTLCTQANVVKAAGGEVPVLLLQKAGPGVYSPRGTYNLGEQTRFDYCSGPTKYAMGPEGGSQ
jgi:hypothetical protein